MKTPSHAPVLRARLSRLASRWGYYREYYQLDALPADPPSAAFLRRRAQQQAREDLARGYRVLPGGAR